MPTLTNADYLYLENNLYLSMVVKVLEKDMELFEKLPFKLNRPYLRMMEDALKTMRKDLKKAEIYMIRKDMRLVKWEFDNDSTTYSFVFQGIEDHRKFLNADIKTKCEELLSTYLAKLRCKYE